MIVCIQFSWFWAANICWTGQTLHYIIFYCIIFTYFSNIGHVSASVLTWLFFIFTSIFWLHIIRQLFLLWILINLCGFNEKHLTEWSSIQIYKEWRFSLIWIQVKNLKPERLKFAQRLVLQDRSSVSFLGDFQSSDFQGETTYSRVTNYCTFNIFVYFFLN